MAEVLDVEEDFFARATPPSESDVEWEVERAPADPRLEARRGRLRRLAAAVIGVASVATLVLAISVGVRKARVAYAPAPPGDDLRIASAEVAMPRPEPRRAEEVPSAGGVEPARTPQKTPASVRPKRVWAWKKGR